jgi:DivIVA domain-containing protein
MTEKKMNLTVQEILDKEFNIDFKGYSPSEVDRFLDLMLEDYQIYEDMLREKEELIQEMERTNASLRAKLLELDGKLQAKTNEFNTSSSRVLSNVDTLKRISRLEEQVQSLQEQLSKLTSNA